MFQIHPSKGGPLDKIQNKLKSALKKKNSLKLDTSFSQKYFKISMLFFKTEFFTSQF